MNKKSRREMPADWQIGIVEDDARYRKHLIRTLEADERTERVVAWASAEECLEDSRTGEMTMMLLDVGLPRMSGVALAERLRARHEYLPFVMLTSMEDESIFEALKRGACGYLLKTELEEIVPMVELVLSGQAAMSPRIALHVIQYFHPKQPSKSAQLTERELEVLRLLTQGADSLEVAATLEVSRHTVKFHIRNIYTKLNVGNRAELTRAAISGGYA